ncbi:MAG: thermonuclease family protein [Deltaproteobacteria bacterium]|nr:thermonuclease family protein [Deltaproteobacteria bacterium]
MQTSIRFLFLVILSLVSLSAPLQAKDLSSYAFVSEDGSLEVSRQKIWLYGIYIPTTDRTCRTYQIPVICGPRATLALEFKIRPHFIECEERGENEDGSITALCRLKGEDLSAWMLQEGWAVALPDAPFEYQMLEKIARARGRGIWGKVIGPP